MVPIKLPAESSFRTPTEISSRKHRPSTCVGAGSARTSLSAMGHIGAEDGPGQPLLPNGGPDTAKWTNRKTCVTSRRPHQNSCSHFASLLKDCFGGSAVVLAAATRINALPPLSYGCHRALPVPNGAQLQGLQLKCIQERRDISNGPRFVIASKQLCKTRHSLGL